METLQIMVVLASCLAIALVAYWYYGEKKEEPKNNTMASELVSSTFRTATFVEQKPASIFEEIAPQTTASTSMENLVKTEKLEASETVKAEPIQSEFPQTPIKVEPSSEKGPELPQMPTTGQETIQAPAIQEQSSLSEVKATGTRRRRSTGTRRRSKKQESETPQQ
jgi:hypothetical protein